VNRYSVTMTAIRNLTGNVFCLTKADYVIVGVGSAKCALTAA